MSTGAFSLKDIDPTPPPTGQFSAGDIDQHESESSIPDGHWLGAVGDTLKDLAKGVGEGALQDVNSVSRVINKIPVIGETLAPAEGINAARQLATPANTTQKVGAGLEQAGELMLPTGETGLGAKILYSALRSGASTAMHEGGTTAGVNPKDVAASTAIGAVAPVAEAGIKGALTSKLARGAVNESMMTTARDVTYGNPAKALLDEGISTPFTGDLEKFKAAIRSGATLQGAANAAGGRIASVSNKINEIAPQLQAKLASSNAPWIPSSTVTDVIDKAVAGIKANRGITAPDAQAAESALMDIKDAALKVPTVPGASASAWAPVEANALKQEIGQNVNWSGKERIGELVEPVRKQVYSALKDAVNSAVPGTAQLNERLTNLYAAQDDINKLAGFEEVGRGRAAGGVIGPNWMGRLQALAGRFIPAGSWLTPAIAPAVRATTIPIVNASGTPSQ